MKPVTKIASVIFGIIALMHLYRLITHFQISAFGQEMPLWVNVAGFFIASLLSWGLWKESKSIEIRKI